LKAKLQRLTITNTYTYCPTELTQIMVLLPK
jgi:hypothetical protein